MATHVHYKIDRRNKYTTRSRNNKERTAADERKAKAQKNQQDSPARARSTYHNLPSAQRTSRKIAFVTKKKCTRNAAPNSCRIENT